MLRGGFIREYVLQEVHVKLSVVLKLLQIVSPCVLPVDPHPLLLLIPPPRASHFPSIRTDKGGGGGGAYNTVIYVHTG